MPIESILTREYLVSNMNLTRDLLYTPSYKIEEELGYQVKMV